MLAFESFQSLHLREYEFSQKKNPSYGQWKREVFMPIIIQIGRIQLFRNEKKVILSQNLKREYCEQKKLQKYFVL